MNEPIPSSLEIPNQTGAEMLRDLSVLDAHLSNPGLTPDAIEALRRKRSELYGRFTIAVDYAVALAQETGAVFPNPFELPTEERTTEPTKDEVPESKDKIDLWTHLTPEQATKARAEITRLAETFNRDEVDFGLIQSKKEDEDGEQTTVFKVMLTSTNGIDLGDPENRYDPKRNWENALKVTEDSALSGITFEDTKALVEANPEINEYIWLTGRKEKADVSGLWVSEMFEGTTRGYTDLGSSLLREVVFRPAATIA